MHHWLIKNISSWYNKQSIRNYSNEHCSVTAVTREQTQNGAKTSRKGQQVLQVHGNKLIRDIRLSVAPNDYLSNQTKFTKNFIIVFEPPTDKISKDNLWFTVGSKTETSTDISIIAENYCILKMCKHKPE